jgi:hypothetical protein
VTPIFTSWIKYKHFYFCVIIFIYWVSECNLIYLLVDLWQASYRYTILWVAFLDPSDSYFLFADLVGFYTHWTYMHIFRHIFLSNYWWKESDIWSPASYRYAILWEAFLYPSDSYFLCRLSWFLYTLNIYAHFSSHFHSLI